MTFTRVILALACLMSGTLVAQEAKVTQLLSKDLTSLPGKEGLVITVEYPQLLRLFSTLLAALWRCIGSELPTVVSRWLVDLAFGAPPQSGLAWFCFLFP